MNESPRNKMDAGRRRGHRGQVLTLDSTGGKPGTVTYFVEVIGSLTGAVKGDVALLRRCY